MAKPNKPKAQEPIGDKRRPQVLEMVHAVALEQGKQSYRVYYLEIPKSELHKYVVSSEMQDYQLAEAKAGMHFRKMVVKL